ncbi:MAG TPA: sigma-54 dependent transcriptional regulator [Candidatus Binatia bacterium]|jgi:DNA-binding NtrC family response regulator|nr:sigma-54 dependent transcriptional regulator [Candidatus Binatia bacterium]
MDATGGRVLVVDDDAAARELFEVRLGALNCEVAMASDGREALSAIRLQTPALVLLDLQMPGMGGMEVLRALRRDGIDLPVIVITAHGSIERAVEAMKEGAYDFILKPFDPKHLEIVVRKALERENLKREVKVLTEEVDKRYQLVVGKSARMNEAVETARKAAASKSTVLLLGESGTGKEIFARSIHNWSERKDMPFIAINCVGLSKELLESELFGHEKGAFTGAHELKRGKMELAHSGTVFLDEVGDISPELQTKLLRFLQEREFERVGGTKPVSVDVRIVAATNRDLERAVSDGRFRLDLYHRLNVIPITLPPLKERKEDISSLTQYFMRRFSQEAKKTFSEISQDVLEKLGTYEWPGNVRELANVIERAVVLGQEPRIEIRDLPSRIAGTESVAPKTNLSYREALEICRREVILRALSQSGRNRATAARALGLHEKYLATLIKNLGIE